MIRIEIQIKSRVIVVTSLEWWTWLVPPLASFLWTVPIVVVVLIIEAGAIFTGFEVVVPRMSIVATDFAREVRTDGLGIVFSMLLEFGPSTEVFE